MADWRRDLRADLKAAGFEQVGSKGGFTIWRHPSGARVQLPTRNRKTDAGRFVANQRASVRRAIERVSDAGAH